ncbi:MAG: hypothetical protein H6672_15030 [Anaerolineaceae bacterium]|nr:hypothetical protein [Anaerolineaceae bacterium]
MTAPISINTEQARRMGQHIVALNWKSAGYDTINAALPPDCTDEQAIDYFFFTSMLLFDFKNIETTLPDGTYLKGTNVFFHLAKHAPEIRPDFWSAALATMPDDDYNRAFSLTHNPAQPTMPRMDERIALLRDAAAKLLERWDGSASRLLAAHPNLKTANGNGLLEVVQRTFQGYDDPLYKKQFVFLKALDVTGRWQPRDPENIQMPVDYHVIRLALRNGTITVHDPALAAALRENQPCSAEDEAALRTAIMMAYDEMIRSSGLSVYFVDEVFWLVGRSCCHYARPPRCAACDFSDCTVQPAFGYTCPGKCPLAGACLGAQDEAYRSLLEPNVVTTYY